MIALRPLNVLVADDSAVSLKLLVSIINAAPAMCVVGEATTGRQAIKLAQNLRPDVIVMDVIMPDLTGVEAIQEIMRVHPLPIVAVSAHLGSSETTFALDAIKAGALTAVPKPPGPRSPTYYKEVATLVNTVRAMADVEVIHHRISATPAKVPVQITINSANLSTPPEIVAIAASTGGPAALSEILQNLPTDFSVPVVIVQHIAADFVPSLVQHLAASTSLPISLAVENDQPMPSHIYLAPGNAHLRLTPSHRFSFDPTLGTAQFMPSANILLQSVARSYGAQAVGIVLTGMGNDGTLGLNLMREAGAFTIAQDELSSVVFGMPKAAIAAGAVRQVLSLSQIAETLIALTTHRDIRK